MHFTDLNLQMGLKGRLTYSTSSYLHSFRSSYRKSHVADFREPNCSFTVGC
jgi:hypothetical protein